MINSVSDEALIFPSNNVLAVDRMIMDFTKNDKFFGNKTLILCGDPRQTLPVIPEGSWVQIVFAILKNVFGTILKKLGLTVNKRVIKNGNTLEARQFTEDVGDHSKKKLITLTW